MWTPQPGPQADAISADWCEELFFGGARGGGKSEYLIGDYLQDVPTYGADWTGIFIRRTYPELEEVIRRTKTAFPETGAEWSVQAKEWTWPNGAVLKMRYLESVDDASRYQGHEYSWIGWDELTQWPTLEAYRMLKACLRGKAKTKRIRASGNPGGPGHTEVKRYFIDPAPTGYQVIEDPETHSTRKYIPSRVTDNKILLAQDPHYIDRLRGVGSPELVKAWLDGEWNILIGAYFTEFRLGQHVIKPFPIPKHWAVYFGFDWGFASPFAGVWVAVSSGKDDEGRELPYPKGALIMFREIWGQRLTNPEIARAILRAKGESWERTAADPSIFKQDGGPSIAEQLAAHGLDLAAGDNTRLAGWSQIRQRLIASPPLLYVFETCPYIIECMQAAQHDEKHPEDLDTTGPDHVLDALRYACMARPIETALQEPKRVDKMGKVTVKDYVKRVQAERSQPRI